jgi:hypothetical protein
MKESACRRALIAAMKGHGLHPEAIENGAKSGTPDVNYVYGWIELKMHAAVLDDDVVKVSRFTPAQRNWLKSRRRAGGVALVVLRHRKGGAWLLLDGRHADLLDRTTLGALRVLGRECKNASSLARYLRDAGFSV